jgi:hypothetical protein
LGDRLEENLASFEDILVAGFSSPLATSVLHPTIVLWNEMILRMGERELQCPEQILDSVRRQRRIADVLLPFGVEDDMQVEETMPVPSPHISRLMDQISESSDSSPRKKREARWKKPALLTPDSREDRRSARLKRRAQSEERRKKLPHEDSQIQFISVEPVVPSVDESQHLTEHQKEVAEMQRTEAAGLYPDMNHDEVSDVPMSSPIVASVKRRASQNFRRRSQPPPDAVMDLDSHLTEDEDVLCSVVDAPEPSKTQFYSADTDDKTDPIGSPMPEDPSSMQLVEEMRASFQMASQTEVLEHIVEEAFVNEQGKRPRDEEVGEVEMPPSKRVEVEEQPATAEAVLDQLRMIVESTKATSNAWTQEQRLQLGDLVFELQAAARGLLG